MDNKKLLGKRIKELRKTRNITQQDLAEMLDQSVWTIYKYWNGTIARPDDKKKILAEKTGLDIYEIFYNEEL